MKLKNLFLPGSGNRKPIRMVSYIFLGVGLSLCIFFSVFPVSVMARPNPENVRRENEIRSKFFSSLSGEKRLELIRFVEQQRKFTPAELGARYRWGYIPVDRETPAFLGEWWNNLSEPQRNRRRLIWFRQNKERLNVDQAARALNLKARLFELQRKYMEKRRRRPSKFEPVDFSLNGDTTPPDKKGKPAPVKKKETEGPLKKEEPGPKKVSPKKEASPEKKVPAKKKSEADQTVKTDKADKKNVDTSTASPAETSAKKQAETVSDSAGSAEASLPGKEDRSETVAKSPGQVKKTQKSDTKVDKMDKNKVVKADTSAKSDSEPKHFYWREKDEIRVREALRPGKVDKNSPSVSETAATDTRSLSPDTKAVQPEFRTKNKISVEPQKIKNKPAREDLRIAPPPLKNVD